MRSFRSRASKKVPAKSTLSSSDSEDEPFRPQSTSKKSRTFQSPISDSDTEDYDHHVEVSCEPVSQKAMKLAMSPISDSETESDEEQHVPVAVTPRPSSSGDSVTTAARSSGRIKERRSREFHMPSKEKVLQDIPTTRSPEKSLQHLQPRKLVNDFTRVNNRYCHDALEMSGDSSLEDFVVDEPSSVSDYSSDSDPPPKKPRRSSKKITKGSSSKKSRLVHAASPSTSDGSDSSVVNQPTESTTGARQSGSARKSRLIDSSSSEAQSDSDEVVQIKRKMPRNNSVLIDSDFSDLDTASDEHNVGQRLSDSDGELPDLDTASNGNEVGQRLSDSDPDSESAELNHNISLSRRRHSRSVDSAGASEVEAEDADAGVRGLSERAQLMADRKQAKLDLLYELKKSRGQIVDADSDSDS